MSNLLLRRRALMQQSEPKEGGGYLDGQVLYLDNGPDSVWTLNSASVDGGATWITATNGIPTSKVSSSFTLVNDYPLELNQTPPTVIFPGVKANNTSSKMWINRLVSSESHSVQLSGWPYATNDKVYAVAASKKAILGFASERVIRVNLTGSLSPFITEPYEFAPTISAAFVTTSALHSPPLYPTMSTNMAGYRNLLAFPTWFSQDDNLTYGIISAEPGYSASTALWTQYLLPESAGARYRITKDGVATPMVDLETAYENAGSSMVGVGFSSRRAAGISSTGKFAFMFTDTGMITSEDYFETFNHTSNTNLFFSASSANFRVLGAAASQECNTIYVATTTDEYQRYVEIYVSRDRGRSFTRKQVITGSLVANLSTKKPMSWISCNYAGDICYTFGSGSVIVKMENFGETTSSIRCYTLNNPPYSKLYVYKSKTEAV